MVKNEILLLWFAVGLYALSSCLFLFSLAFNRIRHLKTGIWLAFLGFLPHSAALGMRWLETGHGPYMRVYEVYSSDVWIALVMFFVLQLSKPNLRVLGAVVLPASFLLIGMAVMASPEIRPLPPNFQTFWLIVHIFFAKLAFGSLLIATGFAFFYLLKRRQEQQGKVGDFFHKLPDLPVLDELSYQFTGFGFFMLAIMIVAGSIWANKAWGRYWGWDAVETWSLITWLVYGIYLHLRRTYGWKEVKASWFSVLAFAVFVFAIFGIGLFYVSVHSPYISG
ncbi:MAG: c-type cytochrome biogenesis protein CcsB [Carboxydocellales bacterium]